MSALDQPLLITQCNYHVRHQMSVRIPEEQGFLREESLTDYEYDGRGLIPGPFERAALGAVMRERGVDIATAVGVEAAIAQRLAGEDVYIVGAWRFMPRLTLYGGKHIKTLADLRGRKIGLREPGGIQDLFITHNLRQHGVHASEVEWVYDPVFAYSVDPVHVERLRSGAVDVAPSGGRFAAQLEQEGFPLVLDSASAYPQGRPGKVIVATRQTVEQRSQELRAFLRAVIRGFWFIRDAANYAYISDLERRLRKATHNEDERQFAAIPEADGLEQLGRPIYGSFPPEALARVINEMLAMGQLDEPIPVEAVLRDEPAREAFRELSARSELRPALERAMAGAQKHGY